MKTNEMILSLFGVRDDKDRDRNKELICAVDHRIDDLSRGIVAQTDMLTSRHAQSDAFFSEGADNIVDSLGTSSGKESQLGHKDQTEAIEVTQKIVVKSLAFPSMGTRENGIIAAHANTFEWIFKRTDSLPWDDFMSWLGDKSGGASIYWISGKAASGKSTLMKLLTQDARVEEALKQWAGHTPRTCAKYFFHNLGSHLQKSHAGLLLSLLHQAFEEFPGLIKDVVPEIWQRVFTKVVRTFVSYPGGGMSSDNDRTWERIESHLKSQASWNWWSLSSLKRAFHSLMWQKVMPPKHCYFIDGLDEFDGDHTEIAAFLQQFSNSKTAKFCVSSRLLPIFKQELRMCPKLRLQDLTVNDITTYVRDHLNAHSRATELAEEEPQLISQLIREIVQTASGVFLWVSLVVKSLLAGMTNFDRTSDLRKRLRELPAELDGLYTHMINRIQPAFYVEQASRLFQLMYLSHRPTSTLALSFADDEDCDVSRAPALEHGERERRVRSITGRVNSRCAGLLEVKWGYPELSTGIIHKGITSEVRYMHLTVKEFLEKPSIWTRLTNKTAGTDFNVAISLLNAVIVELHPNNPVYTEIHYCNAREDHVLHLAELAMVYALQAENSTGVAQMSLLNQLERNIQSICSSTQWTCNHLHCPTRPGLHTLRLPWSGADSEFRTESFLTFAVSRGLVRYVQARLGGPVGLINYKSNVPLLECATTCRPEDYLGITSQPPMVAMLLKAGLKPNERRTKRSSWEYVLERLCVSVEKHISLDNSWLDICKLFVMYGAARNASCNRDVQCGHTVVELVQTAFSHLLHEAVQDLVRMISPHTAQGKAKRKSRKRKRNASG